MLLPEWAGDVDMHPRPSSQVSMTMYGERTLLILKGKETVTLTSRMQPSKSKQSKEMVIGYGYNKAVEWILQTVYSVSGLLLVIGSLQFVSTTLRSAGAGAMDSSCGMEKLS